MNWKTPRNGQLVRALLALQTTAEAQNFLRDLLTEKEIDEFAKRFEAAELLVAETPYTAIEAQTGLSSTTVARVAKCVQGPVGGYQTIINRLSHHPSPRVRRGLS